MKGLDILLEICCGSADDVFAAKAAGAHRVELNSALFLGGLTPSIGTLRTALKADIPVMAMLRPRSGGFCYTDLEIQSMCEDAEEFADAGAAGLVFGCLTPEGEVDVPRCRELLAHTGSCQRVFHRAIDVVPDWRKALDQLMDLGFDRVLTSGQAPRVLEGQECLREMVEYAAGRIEILPGAGFNKKNAKGILRYTGCTQMHMSMSSPRQDNSTGGNPAIFFGGALYPPENSYKVADADKIADLLTELTL